MKYTLEINYIQGGFVGFEAFDGCTQDEIDKCRDAILRSIVNETHLVLKNGEDELILPPEVMKTAVFKIITTDDEERSLHNF